jgi:hypothetical protein
MYAEPPVGNKAAAQFSVGDSDDEEANDPEIEAVAVMQESSAHPSGGDVDAAAIAKARAATAQMVNEMNAMIGTPHAATVTVVAAPLPAPAPTMAELTPVADTGGLKHESIPSEGSGLNANAYPQNEQIEISAV